ncbi:MAG: hypothetical protein MJB14_13705, partial [Spirochaetes bacterium]|nr:hypothetical protein [Spirochaetota bacterium]
YSFLFFKLKHLLPTFGFVVLDQKGNCLFSYIPDTIWTENIDKILQQKPKMVLMDLNGKKDDLQKVHISIDDVIQNGLSITKNDTIYYGTHLKEEFHSISNLIRCSRPGDLVEIY